MLRGVSYRARRHGRLVAVAIDDVMAGVGAVVEGVGDGEESIGIARPGGAWRGLAEAGVACCGLLWAGLVRTGMGW